jgi:hypothetical protein
VPVFNRRPDASPVIVLLQSKPDVEILVATLRTDAKLSSSSQGESALTMVGEAEPVMHGTPRAHSDVLVQTLLTLKQVYYLKLRAAQGFAQSSRAAMHGAMFYMSTKTA